MSLKNLSATIKIHKLFKQNLKNKKIYRIYDKFEKSLIINNNFAVAVSGGPDSLALAFLAKMYSLKKNIKPKFFIIDHKLRNESTREAKKVKEVLKKIFIDAEILTWKGKKPTKNIQSTARIARYNLLLNKCAKFKIHNILLGHHQDDLYENFFIRMLRGSGLKGLISLDKMNKYNNVNLLRPLLDQKKEDLLYLTKHVFNFYVKDPSNQDEKYQRTRVRKLISGLQQNGLDEKKLIKTIYNLKLSNEVINFCVKKNIEKNSFLFLSKKKIFINKEFFCQPYEVVFRGLADLLKLVGEKYYPVRGKKLDNIITNLRDNKLTKVTLGNCLIEKVSETVIISKER